MFNNIMIDILMLIGYVVADLYSCLVIFNAIVTSLVKTDSCFYLLHTL